MKTVNTFTSWATISFSRIVRIHIIVVVNAVIRSLHDVHEMNAYRASQVRLSVRMNQLENRWTYLD
jgi:hypothetical protein